MKTGSGEAEEKKKYEPQSCAKGVLGKKMGKEVGRTKLERKGREKPSGREGPRNYVQKSIRLKIGSFVKTDRRAMQDQKSNKKGDEDEKRSRLN